MADVRLESYDGGVLELPDVCMQCGEPASVRKRKKFSWFPPWIWILLFCSWVPFLIVALVMTKRRTVEAPLCEEHKNHWFWRQLLVVGSLFGVLAVGVVAWSAVIANEGVDDGGLSGFVCLGAVVLGVLWLILAVIVQSTSIRVKEITDRNMTLTGVAPAFVAAYEETWRVPPQRLDELARERWNSGRRGSGGGRAVRDDERIQADDEDRQQPPDAFREGTS